MSRIFSAILMAILIVCLVACGTSSKSTPAPTGGTGGTGSGGGSSAPTVKALGFALTSPNSIYAVKAQSDNTAAAVAGSPFMNPSPVGSAAVRNNLLFVSSSTDITGYKVDAAGVPSKVSSTAAKSARIALDPSGKFLYASGYSDTFAAVYGFSVDANGNLTPLAGSPYLLVEGENDGELAVANNVVCLNIGMGHGTPNIDCYPRRADGSVDTTTVYFAANGANGAGNVAISSDGMWAYTAGNNLVYYGPTNSTAYSTTNVALGGTPSSVAAHPSAPWLAVACTGANTVNIFKIGSNGAPTAATSASAPGVPTYIAFSADGHYLFVATNSGTLAYSFDSSTGNATLLSGSPVGSTQQFTIAAQ